MSLDIAVGFNQKASRASGGILDHLAGRGLHHLYDGVDQRARGEVLTGAGFGLVGVFLQQPFIHVAEVVAALALFPVEPLELVHVADQLAKLGGLGDGGVDVLEDGANDGVIVNPELNQHVAVETVLLLPQLALEIAPAIPLRQQICLLPGLFAHFEKQQGGEFVDIVLVGDAAVAQVVAQFPQLGDQIVIVH